MDARGDDVTDRLRARFEARPEVVAAYLFGSAARGETGPQSDVDLAVVLADGLSADERFRLRLAAISDAAEVVGDDVDLVVLNDVGHGVAFEAISGHRLFVRDLAAAARFEAGVMARHLDRRYYEDRHRRAFLERAAR